MAKTKAFLFATSGGFSIEGKGTTPRKGVCDALKQLKKMRPEVKRSAGKITGRYNTFDRNGLAQTGVFPKKIKIPKKCN